MNEQEIRQGIANLPPTAQSKPLLDAMLNLAEGLQSRVLQLEGSQSNPHNPTLAAMRQELDALKGEQSPGHPPGLCQDSACGVCVAQGEAIVALGRGQVQSDIDTALLWYGGTAWQGKIAGIVQKWLAAGRPQPTSEPALHILAE